MNEDAAHAHLAHLAEGDLLRPHAAIKAARNLASNCQSLAAGPAYCNLMAPKAVMEKDPAFCTNPTCDV
jgi:hypothetical protein